MSDTSPLAANAERTTKMNNQDRLPPIRAAQAVLDEIGGHNDAEEQVRHALELIDVRIVKHDEAGAELATSRLDLIDELNRVRDDKKIAKKKLDRISLDLGKVRTERLAAEGMIDPEIESAGSKLVIDDIAGETYLMRVEDEGDAEELFEGEADTSLSDAFGTLRDEAEVDLSENDLEEAAEKPADDYVSISDAVASVADEVGENELQESPFLTPNEAHKINRSDA